MEYSEDKAKNPAPNGITAAEIEALSTKVHALLITIWTLFIIIIARDF